MSIVEVVMTVCLVTAIETCEQKTTVFGPFEDYQLTREDCDNNGLVVAKGFLKDNKEWAVTGWTCKQKVPAER